MKQHWPYALGAAIVMIGSLCSGANINWDAPQNISGNTDVSLEGTLVRAANMTPSGQSLDVDVTLNGVTFLRAPRNDASTNRQTLPNGDFITAVDDGSAGSTRIGPGNFEGFGGDTAPFNTLSTNYQTLLSTAYWNDGDYTNAANTARWVLELNNLTVGQRYQLQVWVNDYRLSNLGQNNPDLFTTVSDGTNSVDLQHNVQNVLGGMGQYAIGTFVADATDQVVTLTGGNAPGVDTDNISCTAIINAYQLRAIASANGPVFTNIMRMGDSIILQGSNGVPQGAYQMLRSAELSQPLGNWQGIGIKSFDADGNFSFTNAFPANTIGFYRLLELSTGPVYPPEITSNPEDLTIGAGQTANFNVTATGTDLTYRWYYNSSTLLASGSSATLTLPNVQMSDSGSYFVTVSNLLGEVSSVTATLTVTNLPGPSAPTGLTATANNAAVSLSWNAVSGATSYIVKRSTIDGGPYDNISTNTATSYLDSGLASGTTYYYVVSAVNAAGEGADSGQASATPYNAPPITVPNFGFETPSTSSYVYGPGGASWTFSPAGNGGAGVSANGSGFTEGNPPAPQGLQVGFIQGANSISQTINGFVPGATYAITFAAANRGRQGWNTPDTWDVRIDGVTLGSFANVPITYQDYTVTFTATASSETLAFVGTYNGDATVFLDNVRVASVMQPPGIQTQPSDVTESIGRTAQFSVVANGAPPLRYQWYYNTNTALIGQTNPTLTLTNAQPTEAGTYSVTVTNVNGKVTSDFATLTVTAVPPIITAQPSNLGCAVGQSATFGVTAIGSLPLHYQWYYNTNTALTGETNRTLTLFNTATNQSGKYSVTITNLYGVTNSAYATLTVSNALVAFPGAEGYGKYTTGGHGGTIYEVTTLNPTGTGSLEAAIDASGPRTVVFRVGGIITNNFTIRNGDITIAGQTAPGDGICIKGDLEIDANNVIVRYIRCRPDTAAYPETESVWGRYVTNVILDHVSASWSGDETLSLYAGKDITIQWCIIAEACAKFINGSDTGHQFGSIWGNQYSTYHHNLIADNVSRNPRWASGCGYNDYRNNVIYNWEYQSCYGGEKSQTSSDNGFSTINMIANYCKAGPATESGVRSRIAQPSERSSTDKGNWYVADNYVDGYPDVTTNNWLGVDGTSYVKMNAPWDAMPINQETAEAAYTNVLAEVGCSFPQRDSVDATIIQDVRDGTATWGDNGILTYPTDAGGGWPVYANGTPPVDNNQNGVPDSWETAHGLNLNTPSDVNEVDPNGQGYTYLEEYINSLVPSN